VWRGDGGELDSVSLRSPNGDVNTGGDDTERYTGVRAGVGGGARCPRCTGEGALAGSAEYGVFTVNGVSAMSGVSGEKREMRGSEPSVRRLGKGVSAGAMPEDGSAYVSAVAENERKLSSARTGARLKWVSNDRFGRCPRGFGEPVFAGEKTVDRRRGTLRRGEP
jgi:hypothetical protein